MSKELRILEQEIKEATTVKSLKEINSTITGIAKNEIRKENADYELLRYADKLGNLAIDKIEFLLKSKL